MFLNEIWVLLKCIMKFSLTPVGWWLAFCWNSLSFYAACPLRLLPRGLCLISYFLKIILVFFVVVVVVIFVCLFCDGQGSSGEDRSIMVTLGFLILARIWLGLRCRQMQRLSMNKCTISSLQPPSACTDHLARFKLSSVLLQNIQVFCLFVIKIVWIPWLEQCE